MECALGGITSYAIGYKEVVKMNIYLQCIKNFSNENIVIFALLLVMFGACTHPVQQISIDRKALVNRNNPQFFSFSISFGFAFSREWRICIYSRYYRIANFS